LAVIGIASPARGAQGRPSAGASWSRFEPIVLRALLALPLSLALAACGNSRAPVLPPTEAAPSAPAASSAPRVDPSAAPSAAASAQLADARAPLAGAATPPAAVELSAGGAQLRLSRFEPTVAIRGDGQRVALIIAGPADGGVALLFDATTGAELRRWVPPGGTGWSAGFDALQFLPDGRLLAVERGRVHLLGEDGSIQALWKAAVALASPDGEWVASLGDEGLTIRRFDGSPIVLVRGLRRLQTLAFSPDGARLALVRNAASDDLPAGDTAIVVFDRRGSSWKRSAAHKLPGARQENDAAFLSHERLLVDATVLDLVTGAVSPAPATGLSAVSADGQTLLFSADDGSARWARIAGAELGPLVKAVRPSAFADRGLPIAISPLGQVLWCTGSACGLGAAPQP
jgi:hypothetical protein